MSLRQKVRAGNITLDEAIELVKGWERDDKLSSLNIMPWLLRRKARNAKAKAPRGHKTSVGGKRT